MQRGNMLFCNLDRDDLSVRSRHGYDSSPTRRVGTPNGFYVTVPIIPNIHFDVCHCVSPLATYRLLELENAYAYIRLRPDRLVLHEDRVSNRAVDMNTDYAIGK